VTSRKIGVAIIGAGYWGRKLVGEYLALSKKRDDIQLKYVVDCDKDRLASVGKEFDLPGDMLMTDIFEVLKKRPVQAVHLATPNETHFPLGMAVLECHKHLLLEKPMAMTMREALKVTRKAEEESVILNVGHIFRFNNAVREARSLLTSGAIGKPLYYNMRWEALLKPPKNRDIIFDLGPHPTDVLNYLSNEWPVRVLALAKSFLREKPGQEEVAEAFGEFEDSVFAHIALSWLHAGPKRRHVSVTGDSGTIEVDALNQQIMLYHKGASKNHHVQVNNTIESMITHFINNIVKDEAPQNSGLVGAMTVGVLSSMRESMKYGRFVNVIGGCVD